MGRDWLLSSPTDPYEGASENRKEAVTTRMLSTAHAGNRANEYPALGERYLVLRERKREDRLEALAQDTGAAALMSYSWVRADAAMADAGLDRTRRRIVLLKLDGRSSREIADMLKHSHTWVNTQFRHARHYLEHEKPRSEWYYIRQVLVEVFGEKVVAWVYD